MKVKLLHPSAICPTRGTAWSAGWDLYAVEDIIIIPGTSEVIPLGIAVDVGKGNFGLLTHRSSFGFKLDTIASFGCVDADYRGEVKVKLFNLGADGVYIKTGDRVAQLLIVPVEMKGIEVLEELEETFRGEGGFGHSGV